MDRIILTAIVLVAIIIVSSCSADINPSATLKVNPENLDFSYIQVYSKSAQSVYLESTGGLKVTLNKIYLDFTHTTTTDSEISIKAGEILDDYMLGVNETHEVNIEFRPLIQGLREAYLTVKYSIGSQQLTKYVTITGTGYKGFINVQPAILNFGGLLLGESKTETITVTNSNTKSLTINSISVSNLSPNTQVDEYTIVEGWDGNTITLEPEQTHIIKVKFSPASYGTKSAKLIVNIAESTFNFNSTLQSFCYEPLKITTASPLPDAIRGTAYNCPITCEGGDGNYSVKTSNSTLPQGLLLPSLSITGTPELDGDYTFTLQASDEYGQIALKTFILHVSYASLTRDAGDVDQEYVFNPGISTGSYTVNLLAKGDIPLTVNSIALSGVGYDSGEAKITSQPALPLTMRPGDKTQIVIKVTSHVDYGRSVKLTVKHTGYNSPFLQQFFWRVYTDPNEHIFILDRSGAMTASCSPPFTVYDLNGNVIQNPNKWQTACSIVKDKITALTNDSKFDIITFKSGSYSCFGVLKEATPQNANSALGWLFQQNPSGSDTGCVDALNSAFNGYWKITNLHLFTDGYLSFNTDNLVQSLQSWINSAITTNSVFSFNVYQIGGSPSALMATLNALPSTQYHCW